MSIPISDIALNVFKIMQRRQSVSLITPTVTGTYSQAPGCWERGERRGPVIFKYWQTLPCVVPGGFAPSPVYIYHPSQSQVRSEKLELSDASLLVSPHRSCLNTWLPTLLWCIIRDITDTLTQSTESNRRSFANSLSFRKCWLIVFCWCWRMSLNIFD